MKISVKFLKYSFIMFLSLSCNKNIKVKMMTKPQWDNDYFFVTRNEHPDFEYSPRRNLFSLFTRDSSNFSMPALVKIIDELNTDNFNETKILKNTEMFMKEYYSLECPYEFNYKGKNLLELSLDARLVDICIFLIENKFPLEIKGHFIRHSLLIESFVSLLTFNNILKLENESFTIRNPKKISYIILDLLNFKFFKTGKIDEIKAKIVEEMNENFLWNTDKIKIK